MNSEEVVGPQRETPSLRSIEDGLLEVDGRSLDVFSQAMEPGLVGVQAECRCSIRRRT